MRVSLEELLAENERAKKEQQQQQENRLRQELTDIFKDYAKLSPEDREAVISYFERQAEKNNK